MNGGLSEWQQAHSLGMSTKNTSKCRPRSTRLFVPVPTHEPVKAKNIPVDETTNMIPLREFNIGLAAGISRKQIASNDPWLARLEGRTMRTWGITTLTEPTAGRDYALYLQGKPRGNGA